MDVSAIVDQSACCYTENTSIYCIAKWAGGCPKTWLTSYKSEKMLQRLSTQNFNISKCVNLNFSEDIKNGALYLPLIKSFVDVIAPNQIHDSDIAPNQFLPKDVGRAAL